MAACSSNASAVESIELRLAGSTRESHVSDLGKSFSYRLYISSAYVFSTVLLLFDALGLLLHLPDFFNLLRLAGPLRNCMLESSGSASWMMGASASPNVNSRDKDVPGLFSESDNCEFKFSEKLLWRVS